MALLTILPCSIRLNKYVTGIGLQVVRGAPYLAVCLRRGLCPGHLLAWFADCFLANEFRQAVVRLAQTHPVFFHPQDGCVPDLFICIFKQVPCVGNT